MIGNFKVDVITPVYNSVKFIEACIASAHQCRQVSKIIVIDDGSTDGTFELLEGVGNKYPKLKLLTHPGRINKGIAKSRNLGIRNTDADWIAFLDSDDYYLPGRFRVTEQVVKENPQTDGVYEPVINRVVSEEGAMRFKGPKEGLDGSVIGIRAFEDSSPFDLMYFGKGGAVHLNGLTIRRTLAFTVGLFDENLRTGEDSVFRLKVAYKGFLLSGSNQAVAVRSIHDSNTEPTIGPLDQVRKYETLMHYFFQWRVPLKLRQSVIKKVLYRNYRWAKSGNLNTGRLASVVTYLIKHPRLLKEYFV